MPIIDVKSPTFWRQLATYIVGASFVGLPLFVHALAPLIPYLVPTGAGMLSIAGTGLLGRGAPPPAAAPARSETPTPPEPHKAA